VLFRSIPATVTPSSTTDIPATPTTCGTTGIPFTDSASCHKNVYMTCPTAITSVPTTCIDDISGNIADPVPVCMSATSEFPTIVSVTHNPVHRSSTDNTEYCSPGLDCSDAYYMNLSASCKYMLSQAFYSIYSSFVQFLLNIV
jgi:hypothetical protein